MKRVLKNVYQWIPFKQSLYTLVRKVWIPPVRIYQHLHFTGLILVDAGKGASFKMMHYGHSLENELFWKGLYDGWEKYSMRTWARLAANAAVIFDIGANTGIYSLVARSVNPGASLHAFEPFTAIHKKLCHNADINGYDIRCNCLAVSNYTGDAVIYAADEEFAYSVTVNQNLWVKDREPVKINIETITLKDYIEQQGINRIDLMKIDVETHEPEVMEGFMEYFLKFRPILLIEILNDDIARQLQDYFPAADFNFYNIDERSGIKKVDFLSKSDYYNFLIVPVEKAHYYHEESFIHP